jgi:hypothetical protein
MIILKLYFLYSSSITTPISWIYIILHTHNSITTDFFGTLQGLTWFICKSEFHLDVKYLRGESIFSDPISKFNDAQEHSTCGTCTCTFM